MQQPLIFQCSPLNGDNDGKLVKRTAAQGWNMASRMQQSGFEWLKWAMTSMDEKGNENT